MPKKEENIKRVKEGNKTRRKAIFPSTVQCSGKAFSSKEMKEKRERHVQEEAQIVFLII